jgi:type II secretory pathway pseudopilin PulG
MRSVMRNLPVLLAILLAGAALGAVIVIWQSQGSQAAQATRTEQSQARQIRLLKSQSAQLGAQVSQLSTQIAGVTAPDDPLSAYSDICNMQFNNQATGLNQTYYLPCTNNAQTIPQPGS